MAIEYTNHTIDQRSVTAGMLISDSPRRRFFRKDHARRGFTFSILKQKDFVYLFQNDTLRYCLPLSGTRVRITGFGTPAGKYNVEAYILN